MTTGLRRDQHRGWELRPGEVTPTELASSVYGVVGSISTIDPDDTASAGVATTVARADHQHAFTCDTPSALTETTTSAEGSSSSHARADHVHATSVLPWGLLAAPTVLTADSSATSGGTELDLALDQTVTTTAGRRVRLMFTFRNLLGSIAAEEFEIRFKENGTQVAAFRGQVHETTANIDPPACVHTYVPTTGSRTFEVFLVRVTGATGNAIVKAGATFPATFTVEDVG